MQQSIALLGILGLSLLSSATSVGPLQALDPAGSYSVSTADEDGIPLAGTLVVRAGEAGGYLGEFSAADGDVVPVLQVTTNGSHLMAMIETGVGPAVVWLQRQDDGAFTGSWHPLGAGINVKATKRTGRPVAPASVK